MKLMLLARVAFPASLFLWALAGIGSVAGAGWGALGAAAIALPVALMLDRPGIKSAFTDRYLWTTGLIFAAVNGCSAVATALLPLPAFAAINQCSPLIALMIAPIWGERPMRNDWLLVLLGIGGALLVVGANLKQAPVIGFLAVLGTVTIVSVSVHRWGYMARQKKHSPWAALLVLPLPSFPFIFFDLGAFGLEAAGLYLLGGVLLFVGNGATYICYQRNWSVTRSLLLKPLSALFLALAGIAFLGDPYNIGTVAGAALIVITSSIVGLEHGRKEVSTVS